jgi:hypothetical protein
MGLVALLSNQKGYTMTIACLPERLLREDTAAALSSPRRRHRTPLRAVCSALREAFLAFRRYERLRSIEVPHDMAIRDALEVGPDRDYSVAKSSCERPGQITTLPRAAMKRREKLPAGL